MSHDEPQPKISTIKSACPPTLTSLSGRTTAISTNHRSSELSRKIPLSTTEVHGFTSNRCLELEEYKAFSRVSPSSSPLT